MSQGGAPPPGTPPGTTLGMILQNLVVNTHPLAQAVTRVETALDRLEALMRAQGPEKSDR